jgi:hypothetical protein
MFWTVPLSVIRSFSLYTQQRYMLYRFADSLWAGSAWILILLASCQQTCMTNTIAACTVKNSWWRTGELPETCRVSFQEQIREISASSWFYYKKFITMHGHMNVKNYWYPMHKMGAERAPKSLDKWLQRRQWCWASQLHYLPSIITAACSVDLTFKNCAPYIWQTDVPLPSRCCILYIFFNNCKYWVF